MTSEKAQNPSMEADQVWAMGFLFGWAIGTYVSYSSGKRNTRLTMRVCLICTCDRVSTRILHPVPP